MDRTNVERSGAGTLYHAAIAHRPNSPCSVAQHPDHRVDRSSSSTDVAFIHQDDAQVAHRRIAAMPAVFKRQDDQSNRGASLSPEHVWSYTFS